MSAKADQLPTTKSCPGGSSSATAVVGPSRSQWLLWVPQLTIADQSGRTAVLTVAEREHAWRACHSRRRGKVRSIHGSAFRRVPQVGQFGMGSNSPPGCGLGVTMEEGDLRSQHVGEPCSAFVDVVMTTGAAEQFCSRCPAGNFERGRHRRNGVCLRDDEQEGDTHGAGASHGSRPRDAEQRPRPRRA